MERRIEKELELLRSSLGVIPEVDLGREVLFPYYLRTLEYLNEGLLELKDSELRDRIDYVLSEFSSGADLICSGETSELRDRIRLEVFDGYADDKFSFTWGHVLGSLCAILKMVYAYLFDTEGDECDCGCPCGLEKKRCCRNTTSDYESWVSNVYPEDEEYDIANYARTGAPWQGSLLKYNDCYRRDKDEEGCSCGCPCCGNETEN